MNGLSQGGKKMAKKIMLLALAMFVLVGCGSPSASDEGTSSQYPTGPIELIAPYAPGGGVDTNCRALSPSLEKALGTTVTTVNKAGAGGAVGFTYIATAKPNGYTIGLGALSSICTNAALGDLHVDPQVDYDYLGGVAFDVSAICVSKDSPFNNLTELVSYAKEHPYELSYGATGTLSLDALLCHNLMKAGDVKINIVNFDGGSEAMAALMGGHIEIMGGTYTEMESFYEDGQVRIIGVGEEMEGFQTFKEQGYPITLTGARRCLMAPKGLDPEVLDTLIMATAEAVKSEDFADRAAQIGLTPRYGTPEEVIEEVDALMDFFLTTDFDI